MQVQREKSDSARRSLEGIEIAAAEERLRRARLEADEVEHRLFNRDRVEGAEGRAAEELARATKHENWRRWIWLVFGIAFAVLVAAGGTPNAPSLPLTDLTARTTPLISTSLLGDDGGGDPPMTQVPPTEEHPSSAKLHREVELVMLKRLGKELGVALGKKRMPYEDGVMEIDGVDPDEMVFVEVFARIGVLKSGQKRKVGTDALKFVALKPEHPKARFILAFADQAAAGSVVGWQRAVQDRHGIERVVVKLPQNLKKRLLEAQATLKGGMETGAG